MWKPNNMEAHSSSLPHLFFSNFYFCQPFFSINRRWWLIVLTFEWDSNIGNWYEFQIYESGSGYSNFIFGSFVLHKRLRVNMLALGIGSRSEDWWRWRNRAGIYRNQVGRSFGEKLAKSKAISTWSSPLTLNSAPDPLKAVRLPSFVSRFWSFTQALVTLIVISTLWMWYTDRIDHISSRYNGLLSVLVLLHQFLVAVMRTDIYLPNVFDSVSR